MAKTNPIGVRFDEGLLNSVKEAGLAKSPQKALNLYEGSYLELVALRVKENNKPENKAKIEQERNPVDPKSKTNSGLLTEVECEVPEATKIEVEIKLIRAEKIPAHRDTILGRKVWNADQQKRISELQKQLK